MSTKSPQQLVQQSEKNAAQHNSQNPQQKMHLLLSKLPADRDEMLQYMLQYAQTDLLCYRVPVGTVISAQEGMFIDQKKMDSSLRWNDVLRARQDTAFDPILDWAVQQYGIVLHCTEGVMPIEQPRDSLQKVAALFSQSNDRELVALAMLVPIFGSVMLTLAVWKNFCSVDVALIAARLDEATQAERYGADAETEAKWALKCADAKVAAEWLHKFY